MSWLEKKKIQKILIITLSNFGDVILTLPIIRALSYKYPKAQIHIIVGEKAFDLLNGNPAFTQVVCYDKKGSLTYKSKLIFSLLKEHFDFVLDFRNTLIPYLVGQPSKSLALNNQLRRIRSRYERYKKLLELLDLPCVDVAHMPLYGQNDQDSLMRKIHSQGLFNLQNMVVVSPGARLPLKRWDDAHFAELIKRIKSTYDMDVVLVGDSFDAESIHAVEEQLRNIECVVFAGKLSQKELAVLIERARLVIANDSAIMHLANYYSRSVIGIFGPTDPAKYGHVSLTSRVASCNLSCQPCEKSVCESAACMHDLSVEDVYSFVEELMERKDAK